MKSAGGLDPIYVAARRVLLDSLEAIEEHLSSLILVGAQAVYLRTGEADVAVPPYTTDGDLAIDPRQLRLEPLIEAAMQNAGFSLAKNAVGIWQSSVEVEGVARTISVDLLVPESLGGGGRRAARRMLRHQSLAIFQPIPRTSSGRRPDIRQHTHRLDADEVTMREGQPVTTVLRTLADVAASGLAEEH